jgi:hypothetical protein
VLEHDDQQRIVAKVIDSLPVEVVAQGAQPLR